MILYNLKIIIMPRSIHLITLLFILTLTLPQFACKKDRGGSNSTSLVEISDVRTAGATKTIALPFTAGTETVTAITLKNTSNSTGNAVHVKLATDNAAVTAAVLMPLPANAYTAPALEYDIAANGTITVPLIINRSNLTVDTTYGIAFTISQVSAGEIAQDAKKIVVKITLRNILDGRYAVTGTLTDFTDPAYSSPDHEILLITTSPTQVKMIPKLLGIEGTLIKNGANLTYYGSFGPVFTFNEATTKITSVVNFYGQPAANTRSAELDPSGSNSWNATTKTITVKYWMNQPSVVAGHRALYTNTYTYIGAR
jgi:hypothetical protein